MAVELPLEPTTPNYRVGTALNGEQFIFDVRWNSRADRDPVTGEDVGAWFFDLRTEGEVMIRAGIKIVLGTLLGGRCTDDRFPNGLFRAIDLTDTDTEAKLDDLGVRVVVYFFTTEEYAAL